jgi:hypothetical protein
MKMTCIGFLLLLIFSRNGLSLGQLATREILLVATVPAVFRVANC